MPTRLGFNLVFQSCVFLVKQKCSIIHVTIYHSVSDSTLLGSMCQETDSKTFESSASSLLVYFHSDDSVNRKGYKARYSSVDKRNKPIGGKFISIV